MKLDKRAIDAAECKPGQRDTVIFDSEIKGFALRVTNSGAKIFLFQYRRGPVVRRLRIGKYGDLTPIQARRRAEQLRHQVAGGGADPVAERRAEAEAEAAAAVERKRRKAADALTFSALIDQWETARLAQRRPRYRAEATRALRYSLAKLADVPAGAIDAAMARQAIYAILARASKAAVSKAAAGEGGAPGATMARRVRAYARAMYAWAVGRGLLQVNPFAPVAIDGSEIARERYLTDAELGEVWRCCVALGWPWGDYFRFLLLTLQRQAEVAGVTWSELSADLSRWDLPGRRTKNGKPHLVHLAEPARAILRAAPRIEGKPLIFTTTGSTPISGFSDAKERLDRAIMKERAEAAAKIGATPDPPVPWRLHDFRRTGVTALAGLGVRWEVCDRLLNHVGGRIHGVAAVYQRHEFLDERETALRQWADHVLAAAGEAPR